jgi:hypothetical protein
MILVDYIIKWFSTRKNLYSLGAFTLIMILLGVNFSYWAGAIEVSDIPGGGGGGPKLTDWSRWEMGDGGPLTKAGYLDENSEIIEEIKVDEPNVISINFTLILTDEPDQQNFFRVYENGPDTFTLRVQGPDGREARGGPTANVHGESGEIIVPMGFTPDIDPYMNGTGTFNVTIELGECQDSFTTGAIGFSDTGNDWELSVEYEYYYKQE